MSEQEPDQDQDRTERVVSAVVKVVVVAVAIGIAIGIGTWVMVKALGLDDATTSAGPAPVTPVQPLPTRALPVQQTPTTTPTDVPTDYPTEIVSPSAGALFLSAAPVVVNAMERINLTGQWPGRDNVALLVQRFENGEWVDFGVQVNVNVGTFATYVMTGREGENKFRVFDPNSNTTSNEVVVQVASH